MNKKLKLNKNVYYILLGIILLGLALQLANSEYVLSFAGNEREKGVLEERLQEGTRSLAVAASGRPYCVAFDGTDEYSVLLSQQAYRSLQYMKKPTQTVDVRQDGLRVSECEAVLIGTNRLELLGDVSPLADYIEDGGYVFFLAMPDQSDAFYRLYRKIGILEAGGLVSEPGIRLLDNVLIGEKGREFGDSFMVNTVTAVGLDPGAQVLAETGDGTPLMWRFAYGGGASVVFNGTILQEKVSRGLIAGGLSMLIPDFIYPIFNAKLMYMDDFPAPIGRTVDPDIYENYRRDRPTFFKEIWWPDMLKAAKRFDMKYTAVLIESYEDRVTPPFAANDSDVDGLVSYGREVLKSGGEVGIHGFNHQSLTLDPSVSDAFGYNAWPNREAMAASIRQAVGFAKKAFPNYTMLSYVPPSNVLSPEGRETLKKAWSDLAVVSSLYGDDASGLAYVQEFEIAEDGVLEMPRITSGYTDQPFERWAEANAMTSLGYFSHFIHPDDLLSEERSYGNSWEKLHEAFMEKLSRVEKTYPWLRPRTSTEAATDIADALTSRVEWERTGGVLKGRIEPFRGVSYYVLRTQGAIGRLAGCDAQRIDEGVYLVEARQAEFEIHLSEE